MKINCQETTLDNGLRVATAAMPHVDSVTLGVWVGVGGRYESKRLSGISHFIEHLLFKGTRKRSAKEISEAIEGRGGYFNAFTQEESTCYYARVAATHLWDVFGILADMYLHPRLDATDIDKERGVIIEEIMMYRDRPHNMVEEMLGESMWASHPLGRTLIGTPANIERMSRKEIMTFKKNNYVPSSSVVVFAGRVDHDDCVRHVQRAMGRIAASRKPSCKAVERATPQDPVALEARRIEQAHLAMGFRLFGRNDPRRYTLKLLSVILGENMSSRLFQVVRERNGLAYSVHSSVNLFADTGALVIQAGLDRKRTERALRLITRELTRLKARPVTVAELQRAKDYAVGQLRLGLESTTSQMMWVGDNLVSYGRFTQPERVIKRLESVTREDIHRVAGQVLRHRSASIAVIAPPEQAWDRERVMQHLAAL